MPGPVNIDSWFEFIVWLLIAGTSAFAAVTSYRNGRHARSAQVDAAAVRDSTVNGHGRPLRYDVDDVLSGIDRVERLARTIGAEVREDRRARREGDEALAVRDQQLADSLSELGRRMDRQDDIAARFHPEAGL